MEIVGDNVDGQRTYIDLHDKGAVEDWNVTTDIADAVQGSADVPGVKIENGDLHFRNTAKAMVYSVDGKTLKALSKPNILSGRSLGKGVFFVKLLNGKQERTVKVVL